MANQIILTLLSIAYAVLCICCIVERQRRKVNDTRAVYLPEYMFWLGIVTGGMFLGFGWFASVQDGNIGLTICFGFFALLGMSLLAGWRNSYIVYDNTGFTQRTLIGKQNSFKYAEVTGWAYNRNNSTEISLYINEKKISLNTKSENAENFLSVVNNGYKVTHGNKDIPEISALKKDSGGFRAHVYNPLEYAVVFCMMFVFVSGVGIWLIVDCIKPIDENSGEQYNLSFIACEVQDENLTLTTTQMEEPFIVNGYENYLNNFEKLVENCDGNTEFSVYAKRFDPDDREPYYRVYALSADGEFYRTFEHSTEYRRDDLPLTVAIFGGFLAVMLLVSAFIYIVGSNPQRFPKWVVYACFKKDAIDI